MYWDLKFIVNFRNKFIHTNSRVKKIPAQEALKLADTMRRVYEAMLPEPVPTKFLKRELVY